MLASSPPRILPVASFLPTAPPKRRAATQPIPTHTPTLHGHGHGVLLLRPPSSRLLLGAAPQSRVAWRGLEIQLPQRGPGRHPSSIWTWIHLAFSLPLPGKESLPPYLALRAGSALEKRSNLSLWALLKTKGGGKNPPFCLFFVSFSPFRSVCTGLRAVLRISV